MGLFAEESLPRGTSIWQFAPGFDQALAPAAIAALPELAREHVRHFAWVSPSDGHSILSGDHACFMNHSTAPNSGVPVEGTDPVTTVALRNIAAGEEITCDYFSFDADASRKFGTPPEA
ncbi:MAG: SET domain-containing protein [Opitutaceae bacterium]|nr:SET domain-containing protein [Verrucomicrobiales bacterium]